MYRHNQLKDPPANGHQVGGGGGGGGPAAPLQPPLQPLDYHEHHPHAVPAPPLPFVAGPANAQGGFHPAPGFHVHVAPHQAAAFHGAVFMAQAGFPVSGGAAASVAGPYAFHGITGGSAVTQWADSLKDQRSLTVWDLLLRPAQEFKSTDPSVRATFWAGVASRLDTHPSDVAVDLYRLYPLHRALMNSAPPEVVRALVEAYPRAVSTPNYNDDYALHIACINKHPPLVLRLLVSCHPDALHHRTEGLLPLHWCTEWWRNSTDNFDLVWREGKRHGMGGNKGTGVGLGLGGLLSPDRKGGTPMDYMCDDAAEKRTWAEGQWAWLCNLIQEAGRESAVQGLDAAAVRAAGSRALLSSLHHCSPHISSTTCDGSDPHGLLHVPH